MKKIIDRIVDRICEAFKEGQNEFQMEIDSRGYLVIHHGIIKAVEIIDISDILKLSGFLIDRDYGFAEAWAKERYPKFDAMSISNSAEVFIKRLALVANKIEWLEKNL